MTKPASSLEKIHSESIDTIHIGSASKKEDKALFGDSQRREILKQTLHWAIIWAVRIASACMIGLFIVRIAHLILPSHCIWIEPARLQVIDSLLFSSFLGAFISRYLDQALPKSPPED